MSDYIKREDATAVIRKTLGSLGNSVITEINSLSGYVADRPTGEWINKDSSVIGITYECSNCGRDYVSAVSYDIKGNEWRYNYCPNCGADMRGGDTE